MQPSSRLSTTPRLRPCALGVLAALGLGAGTAPTAGAATFGTQGFGVTENLARVDQSLDLAARSGAKLARVEASWSQLEPRSPGQRDPAALAALDARVDGAARRGMRVVLFVSSTPCWASSAPAQERGSCAAADANRPGVTRYQPARADSVVPVATFLAARYADRLAAFQVWNEPDQANEKYWAGPDKAVNYAAMVKQLYAPLKQAAPQVPVIVGSFVGTNGKWLQAMYDAGIKGFYDGLAVQFYGSTLYGLRTTHDVQRRNGDRKPLWLTEWGYTACYRKGGPALQLDQPCVTTAGASQAFIDVLTALRTRSYVKAAIQYDVRDAGPGGYTFGLFTAAGRAKASYRAVRRVLTGAVRKPRRPTIRLRASRGRLVVSGTSSLTELVRIRVSQRGQLRLRATLLPDRRSGYRLVLPAVLGTRGLTVVVSAGWTGKRTGRT